MKKLLAPLPLLLALALAGDARAADVFGKTPVKTVTVGDVTVELAGSDGVSVLQVAASNGAAAGSGVFVLGGAYNSSLPTNTSGRSVALQTDVNGRLIVTQDASAGALLENLTKVGGAAIALGQTTKSASLPFTLASDQGNLATNIAQVGGSSLALGQAAMASSVPVVLASNQSTLATTVGAPTGSSFNSAAVTNIAGGSSSTIVCKSGVATSTPTKPLQYVISAAGGVRCQLQYNDNASLTKFANVSIGPGAPTVVWTPPSGIVGLTTSSTSTTQQYEANCTVFDSQAQDVYCSVVYCSAASGC